MRASHLGIIASPALDQVIIPTSRGEIRVIELDYYNELPGSESVTTDGGLLLLLQLRDNRIGRRSALKSIMLHSHIRRRRRLVFWYIP